MQQENLDIVSEELDRIAKSIDETTQQISQAEDDIKVMEADIAIGLDEFKMRLRAMYVKVMTAWRLRWLAQRTSTICFPSMS